MPLSEVSESAGLVDVHAHFVTDSYVRQARAAGHHMPDGVPKWPTWSPEEHLAVMDRSGIDTAMLSISSPGVHFGDDAAARALTREVNEAGAEAVRDHPDRFGLFASLPLPDVEGALAEIDYALDTLRADGVVLETNTHGIYLGDGKLAPVFAELARREAVVFLHPTSPVCWEKSALGRPRPMIEFIFDTARTVTDLLMSGTLERHPELKIIVPHCGGALPVLADRINGFVKLFMPPGTPAPDAIELLRGLYYDVAGPAVPRQIPALLSLADPEHLLYGSDYCWTPAAGVADHVATIDAAPGPVEDGRTWRSLTTANARRILPRLAH